MLYSPSLNLVNGSRPFRMLKRNRKMRNVVIGTLLLTLAGSAVWAQDRIYRCGNEYINNANLAKQRGCKAVEGGNVTVIQSQGSNAAPARSSGGASNAARPAASAPANAPRVSSETQASRDNDARTILEAELAKSQERLSTLEAEYNGGDPVRTALELRNPQGYIERKANLKADIERTQADIEGIQREISRLR